MSCNAFYRNWEPASLVAEEKISKREVIIKRCHTCKYLEGGRFSHPCNICDKHLSKWEKEE